ncbi:MAG: DUF222 domain-containing protein [Nocardioides sp.]
MRTDSGFSGGGGGVGHAGRTLGSLAAVESLDVLEAALGGVVGVDPEVFDEAGAIEAITVLERIKRSAAAAQARLAVRVDTTARARQSDAGVPADKLGAGVGAQIALARMESPHRGNRHLGLAKALTHELPQTLTGMRHGHLSEWRATLVARETAHLDPHTRRDLDTHIAADLPRWGDRETERRVRALAQAADPAAAVARHARAVADRHVTLRPAPDTMCYLTALLPAVHGVAAYAALLRAADTHRATPRSEEAEHSPGDTRGKGQVMADTLVERLTGQTTPDHTPVEIELVMNTETLLGTPTETGTGTGVDTSAHLVGYGPLPAITARHLIRNTTAQVWLRRLFTHPTTGELVAMDSHRHRFEGQLRHLVVLRDQFCRTPWCDAPIRHADHIQAHTDGGPTTTINAQGVCEACDYTKQTPHWHTQTTHTHPTQRHTTQITTPTGHTYTSEAPSPP